VQAESRSRVANLERLRREQASLEKLLRELRRAVQRFPTDSKDPFAKLRGKLTWPAQGRVLSRFGETRAGGLKWEGVLMAAERGSAVHSIYHGRIVYADWLAGLGLLVIVDHGGGYMSLYGHNDSIYRKVGERVDAGDEIAAVGDSGGRPRPELYFEIRRGGQPVDPRPWFRTPAP
jgi:murein hydrolase activator